MKLNFHYYLFYMKSFNFLKMVNKKVLLAVNNIYISIRAPDK